MTSPEGEIVKEYLRKYKSMKSRTLAKFILGQHPDIFTDLEKVRCNIRYYRKSQGDHSRKSVSEYIPYIPEHAEIQDFSPLILKEDDFPIIIGSDAHIPYHDEDALYLFFERAYSMGAKTMILNGDWLDMYQCSRFQKDPRKWGAKKELEMFAQIMDDFLDHSPMRVIYKLGNHEERFDNYIMDHSPAVWGIETFTLEATIKHFMRHDIEIIGNKRVIRIMDISLVHGHEFGTSIFSPVNPARGLFLRAKDTAICGHHHQSSNHKEPNIKGRSITCWSTGCLCDLHPEYAPINKWNHGFCEVHFDGELWNVQNREIVNYRLA